MFELGLMGIEIPEEFGGQGGTFFQSVVAVEEIAAVDPAASVIVDVQNTLVVNALMRWGTDEQKRKYLPRLAATLSERTRYRKLHRDRMLSHCRPAPCKRMEDFALTGRKLWITNAAEAGIFLVFANADPGAGYKGITCFIVERGAPVFRSATKKTSSASGPPPPVSSFRQLHRRSLADPWSNWQGL